ncbi:uncharacterized protein PAC_18117 [Phialocephala subalpina]|uniref:Uncharacterized protein n=1 Tax=Phialocephala subalpina TaxID=576137 RepID=A0A1L7XTB0_9HELO|nr:uncharacterized protein PAC_18117 [Phialocephala subalpina]
MNPPPRPNPGIAKAKTIARVSLKRFGPLLLTGLAAVAEHHWLKQNDDTPSSDPPSSSTGDPAVKELKHEVKKLRRKLKGKKRYRDDSSSSSSDSSDETIEAVYRDGKRAVRAEKVHGRGRSRPLGEEQPQPQPQPQPRGTDEEHERYYRGFETWGPENPNLPSVPDPPQQYERYPSFVPAPQFPFPYQGEGEATSSKDVERGGRRRRHRHQSLPAKARDFIDKEKAVLEKEKRYLVNELDLNTSNQAVHAGQVAAVAGIIEALHVGVEDKTGHWYGRKGLRVGTTVAASYGASLSRHKDPGEVTGLQSAIDVGKGLAVSRLVHGRMSAQNDEAVGRPGDVRRWSSRF